MLFKILKKIVNPDARQDNEKLNLLSIVLHLSGIIIIILIWFLTGLIFFTRKDLQHFREFLPLPAFNALLKFTFSKIFWFSVITSLKRIFVGLLFSSIIGIPIGLFIGFYKNFRKLTGIPIHFFRMISPLAWTPIALIIFTKFESAIYFLITIAAIWPIILNTMNGVINVDNKWIKMAQNQGANDWQLFSRVIIPASLPYTLNGLRMAIGVAWIVLVPAEFIGVNSGLGYLINDARDSIDYASLVALVIAIGVLGFTIDSIFAGILLIFDWRKKS